MYYRKLMREIRQSWPIKNNYRKRKHLPLERRKHLRKYYDKVFRRIINDLAARTTDVLLDPFKYEGGLE